MNEIVLDFVREKECKHSMRYQASNEPKEFRPETPSQIYFKNEILAALGNPAEMEIVLRVKAQ